MEFQASFMEYLKGKSMKGWGGGLGTSIVI